MNVGYTLILRYKLQVVQGCCCGVVASKCGGNFNGTMERKKPSMDQLIKEEVDTSFSLKNKCMSTNKISFV